MKTANSVLWVVAAGALAAGLVFAQAPPTSGAPHLTDRIGARRGQRHKLMAGYLGLTDRQREKAKAIFETAHQSAQPLRQELKQSRMDLRAAIRDGKPVDQLAAARGSLLGRLTAIRAGAAEQFRALLTPAQLQKLQDLHG
jgi:Spy/CpxP family protein refolding chaperone